MKKKNTTSVNHDSISSEETAQSKPWTAVVKLGERIVAEFGLDDGVDTLGRWMAHRVAELMERAENAENDADRETARRECTDLILNLWERRSHWPHGRPLAEIAAVLKNLIESGPNYGNRYERREPEIDIHSWIGVLPRLRELQGREDDVCRAAALADFDLKKSREWLAEHPDDLSDDERKIMENIISERERLDEPYFRLDKTIVPNFTSLNATERAHLVQQTLETIGAERKELLSSVQPGCELPQKRKRRRATESPNESGKAERLSQHTAKKRVARKSRAQKRATSKDS